MFPKARIAVFVDGCFWHGCPEHGAMPKTNSEFWVSKLSRNKERDLRVTNELHVMGWNVLRYWEHDVSANASEMADKIIAVLGRRGIENRTA